MSDNIKQNKIKNIILDVIMYVFLALSAFFVVILVFGQKDIDGTTEVFGHQLRVVTSDSMDKCDATDVSMYDIKSIPIKSMVFVELVPEDEQEAIKWYDNIFPGDVLTFRYVYTTQVTITHRVEKKVDNLDGTFTFTLVGDNKDSDEKLMTQVITTGDPTSTNYIIGKVVGQSKLLGNIVTTLRNPLGMVCIIILPSLAIIVYEIIRIMNVISTEKKKRMKDEYDKKESEIELLKQRLAELEKKQNSDSESQNKEENIVHDVQTVDNPQESEDELAVDSDVQVNNSDVQDENTADENVEEDNKDVTGKLDETAFNETNGNIVNGSKTNDTKIGKSKEDSLVNKKELLQWKNDIEKREKSGLTVDEWCKAKGISKSVYYKRLKKVKEEFGD